MTEAFYWLMIPVVFIGGILCMAAVYENVGNTPYRQAERRRKANARFAELIGEDK